ncbi:MAG: FecR domain-containing protein [Polyangiaceae bacterium]
MRYNPIVCTPGAPLKPGMTLVLPAKVTPAPTARITSVHPDTRARAAGAAWSPAFPGQPLPRNSNVNTREEGRASVQFPDRSRIYLAEHTLVVIFGTASQTSVSKTVPPVAEVQSGELAAGLSALRPGAAARVAVAGGGQVTAASRDTVIRKKGPRTTVAVFDGSAAVASAGKSVDVPKDFGSAIVEKQPPSPPRPLPPAPAWVASGSPSVVLGAGGQGVLRASWEAVPKAAAYRVELARDQRFEDLVLREETPADVRSFRAEKVASGDYWLRVRAIDDEDFLGLASVARAFSVVEGEFERGEGALEPDRLEVSPYGALALTPSPELSLAVDDGPFGPLPKRIDFAATKPRRLRFRRGQQGEGTELRVVYLPPEVTLVATTVEGRLSVQATFEEVKGVDVATAISPRLVVVTGSGSHVPLALASEDGLAFVGDGPVPDDGVAAVELVDGSGRPLARQPIDGEAPPEAPAAPPPRIVIGPTAALRLFSPRLDALAWAPSYADVAAIGATLDSGQGDGLTGQGDALAAVQLGDFGLVAEMRTRAAAGADLADSSAGIGGRYRFLTLPDLHVALGLEIAFPLDAGSPPPRLTPSLALGARYEPWSWFATLGGRLRLDEVGGRAPVDAGHVFAMLGGELDILPWLSTYALIDNHVLIDRTASYRGGLTLGIEAGETIFGGIAGRVAPWRDAGGHVSGQLTFGVRSF